MKINVYRTKIGNEDRRSNQYCEQMLEKSIKSNSLLSRANKRNENIGKVEGVGTVGNVEMVTTGCKILHENRG